MGKNLEYVQRWARASVEVSRLSVGLWVDIGRLAIAAAIQIKETVQVQAFGMEPDIPLAQRLRETFPLDNAQVGMRDIEHGIAAGDSQQTGIGQRAVVRAVVQAGGNESVPDSVRERVIYMARGLPVDPFHSPLVSSDLAEQALQVMRTFDERTDATDKTPAR